MPLLPEPTPLEAVASLDRLAREADQKAKAAKRMRDWRVMRYWRAEGDRLRAMKIDVRDRGEKRDD